MKIIENMRKFEKLSDVQRGSPVQTCFKPLKKSTWGSDSLSAAIHAHTRAYTRKYEKTFQTWKQKPLRQHENRQLRVVVDDRLQSGRADWKILRSRYSRIATLSSTYLYVWTKFSLTLINGKDRCTRQAAKGLGQWHQIS